MKKLKILVHSASNGANSIRDYLKDQGVNVKILKTSGSRYTGNPHDVVLNWGSTSLRGLTSDVQFLVNLPSGIEIASDKIKTFSKLSENISANIPEWTVSSSEAKRWVEMGRVVYCRVLTRASQGRGIVVARTMEEVVAAPLYTVKCLRNREVRIHVFGGKVIDFCQKKKMSEERLEEDGITYSNDVRSHGNGWVFSRDGVAIPEDAQQAAIRAVSELGLYFGAVDMALSLGQPRIFEINTAPGLEGTTLERYCNAIKNLLVEN